MIAVKPTCDGCGKDIASRGQGRDEVFVFHVVSTAVLPARATRLGDSEMAGGQCHLCLACLDIDKLLASAKGK